MDNLSRFIRLLPKTELHLHVEGAVPDEVLLALIEKYEGAAVAASTNLESRFSYETFHEFLRAWHWKNQFIREYEDFEMIAEGVARELQRHGVVHAEVFFSPTDFASHGLSVAGLATSIRRGFDQVNDLSVGLIADLVRDQGASGCRRTLDEVIECAGDAGIVGVGIGGSEAEFPAVLFVDVFDVAARNGLRTTAHAGEADGPQSVRSALHDLGVERIGHGVRTVEDPGLMTELAERRIPLEVCPSSNVATRIYPDVRSHPIRSLFDAGLLVTINTDDPAMFRSNLTTEYLSLFEVHGFDRRELVQIALNGVEASWLSDAEKQSIRASIGAIVDDELG